MAKAILPQQRSYSPTNKSIDDALMHLTMERERLVALFLVLTKQMESIENEKEDSTALILMRMLHEQISCKKTIESVSTMLTGVHA